MCRGSDVVWFRYRNVSLALYISGFDGIIANIKGSQVPQIRTSHHYDPAL